MLHRASEGTDPAGPDSVLAGVAELRTRAGAGTTVVLLAATVTNGAEIAASYGSTWLDLVTAEVTSRLQHQQLVPVRMLPLSPWGGFLAAVAVDRTLARSQVAAVVETLRGMVDLDHDRVWPVVTVRARELAPADDVWGAVRALRTMVWDAGREAPGALSWHADDASALVVRDDLSLVRDLATSLTERPESLALAFQPIRDLAGRRIVGAEALLRWSHPTRGQVSPIDAIGAAERSGLIVPLGRAVQQRAVEQLVRWGDRLDPAFAMHVNVSALELHDAGYVDHLEAVLHDAGVPASRLVLELTETALLDDGPDITGVLVALRELGVRLGVDDFGTGYSSISLLSRLSIDFVKIDRSLVRDVADCGTAFATARAVLALVGTLGITAVAEGIETALQASHLRAMGCGLAQGYHLGRPVPAAAFWVGEDAAAGVVPASA